MWNLDDLLISLVAIPILVVLIDLAGALRATRSRRPALVPASEPAPRDYTVVVPIYGDIKYLTNVAYLSEYGHDVLLVTTKEETPEFYAELDAIAAVHRFRVHRAFVVGHTREAKRQVSGVVRDTIVREAHEVIHSSYVVCIDADTETTESLDVLVDTFVERELDVASVRLEPANHDGLLAKLQAHEYRMAMRLRTVMPWLVSGGCHIARRDAHRDLMRRHSMFFQGNDVELGILASARGYRVGHIPFVVPTIVPTTVRGWWRQRMAWAGGEFRLMIVNLHHSWRHPFLFGYGAIAVFALVPLRWYYIVHPSLSLGAGIVAYYSLLAAVNWRYRDSALLIYPLYALFYSLILVPLGVVSYAHMAMRHHNAGIIRARRGIRGAVRTRLGYVR